MGWRKRRFTIEELKLAYDVGAAHQLILERIGEDNETTSFERLVADLRGSVRKGAV
ncbi:hypothetical protein DFR75_112112 [Nocardia ignorata]|uniref:Uncharacterized protein n=2 Tax=Nocardia ignorata TaxID=145285 RepID=A0A4R6NZ67_NOCIG|nr:hypothetical protein DFR75_112112 [Nocardia ignorata]